MQEQIERLENELALHRGAIPAAEAAKDVREWADAHAGVDYLTKTCEWMNPWVPDKEQKGKKKRKDVK